ncbi:MAG: glycosyltransferase family protein [Candidatus Neomarinimicrobiota bacterium]|jgi:uncharacterized protein (TIGR00661 family)|nr:glycosyltransferase family protein [Candidatus Neomarinimicrobiota bacterium]MDX9780016.1 glycosyltransferase family protein [bacterium]
MNILYGIQTTGNGHIGKSRIIVRELKRRGHQVRVIFSGDQQGNIPGDQDFAPYRIFKGLTYATENGKINYVKTAPRLDAFSYVRDILAYNAKGVDLIVSDYEPISINIAKRNKIPSLGISHQYVFQHDVPYPPLQVLVRTIMEYFAPADFTVPIHWHHFGFPVLPPVITPAQLNKTKEIEGKYVVVYLPYEDIRQVIKMLESCPPDHDYYFFTDIKKNQRKNNIHLLPKDRQQFLNKLAGSQGAILHAGFLANSEAFDLGKKTLAKPISGQAEQIANAMAIEQLHFGKQMNELNFREVAEWLQMPPIRPMHYPDTGIRFVDWIEAGVFNTQSLIALCEELWSGVPIPQIFRT